MLKALHWIEKESDKAFTLLKEWVLENSWSENLEGLQKLNEKLRCAFSPLGDTVELIPLPPWQRRNPLGEIYLTTLGSALSIRKRKKSSRQVLLGGHMDTVYPPLPQSLEIKHEGSHLIGPGVADMKGGLAVLWLAITAFEKFFSHLNLGWEIFINPDEEIGSPGSKTFWEKKGKKAQIGLLFEPSFPDGYFVSGRKGSINFSIVVEGKESHVGRDHGMGRSAVKALSEWIVQAYQLAKKYEETTLNISTLTSSHALNITPKHASCKGNLRSFNSQHLNKMWSDLQKLSQDIGLEQEVKITCYKDSEKFPKPFENKTKALYEWIAKSAYELQIPFKERSSGGLTDGNILQAAGLPTIDTMGVIGGNLHTENEYMVIESLVERAKLTCHFLHQFASSSDEKFNN